jgi:PEP-CTERM motif
MRTSFILLLAFCCLVVLPKQANADPCNTGVNAGNIVSNCAFQTGDSTGWTISGNTANPGGNYYGVDTFDAYPPSTYGAYMSQDSMVSENPVDLGQSLSTTVGTTYTITFFLDQDTAPTTGYTHSFDATWGGTSLLDLNPTVSMPGPYGLPPGGYVEYQFTETATSSSTALTFAFVNDDSYWSFDDISVTPQGVPAPEPSSLLLLGTGLLGLMGMARSKMRFANPAAPHRLARGQFGARL